MDTTLGFYSPVGSDQFMAVPRLDINWAALENETPFQSWEVRVDQEFLEAISRKDDQVEFSIRTRHQIFHPCIGVPSSWSSSPLYKQAIEFSVSGKQPSYSNSLSVENNPHIPTNLTK